MALADCLLLLEVRDEGWMNTQPRKAGARLAARMEVRARKGFTF